MAVNHSLLKQSEGPYEGYDPDSAIVCLLYCMSKLLADRVMQRLNSFCCRHYLFILIALVLEI